MKLSEILTKANVWLQWEGRLRNRSLQCEYGLDDETLADLKDELMEGQEVAVDKDGKMLVWTGGEASEEGLPHPPQSNLSQKHP